MQGTGILAGSKKAVNFPASTIIFKKISAISVYPCQLQHNQPVLDFILVNDVNCCSLTPWHESKP